MMRHTKSASRNNIYVFNYTYEQKSVVLAYFFLIFFGILGLHRFYIDKIKSAFTILILNILAILSLATGYYCIIYNNIFNNYKGFFIISGLLGVIIALWLIFDFFTFFKAIEKFNNNQQNINYQKLKSIL